MHVYIHIVRMLTDGIPYAVAVQIPSFIILSVTFLFAMYPFKIVLHLCLL